ncbi:MAG: hypothetical protein Kow0098_24330 [Ignavibacteriaceae bacterium]
MKTIWILVYTVGGILEEPEIFYSKNKAETRKRQLSSDQGLKDYDDVKIYNKRLKVTS